MTYATQPYRPGISQPGHARGFSLIEVIVAFALMALVLTTALAIAARSYRQVEWSGRAAEASQWAQSLADEADGRTLALGREQGRVDSDRYQWTREVSEYADPAGLMISAEGRPLLWRTRLEVSWQENGQRQSIHLIGLRPSPPARLGAAP